MLKYEIMTFWGLCKYHSATWSFWVLLGGCSMNSWVVDDTGASGRGVVKSLAFRA